MPAYWIARSKIFDPESYWKYAEQVPDIVARYGGRPLARGGRFHVAEGSQEFNRYVVLEFPSMEAAIACHASPEYQAARQHRLPPHGEAEIVIVEAGEFTSAGGLAAAAAAVAAAP
ncbi:DUF1330 domain-containing protein [Variovorax sp. KK3]|uniref:DUF1330 domain-containing protein n=1 Tax=Variovorax sp. KK3 TaxID=1855728 RepID=UPI00097CA275|nr:DUF1330 domain-containing protein [Variovorax sp. KK3]